MNDLPLQKTNHPSEADEHWLEASINQFNIQQTGYDDYEPLVLFIHQADGTRIALRILSLWVQENWRRQGYGTQLLVAAEREACARGCKQAVVETHSFQAPQWYPEQGYTMCGVADDYPLGHQHLTFQKRLMP